MAGLSARRCNCHGALARRVSKYVGTSRLQAFPCTTAGLFAARDVRLGVGILQGLGFDHFQGFLFGVPMSAEAFAARLRITNSSTPW